jgi:iron complex transport system substrate-binding protein
MKAAERFIADDLARPVALDPGAGRVVSLAPSCTECLLALGAGDRLAGVEEHSPLPPALAGVPRVGGFKHVDVEHIVALRPDLVLAASLHAATTVPRLVAHGLRVFVTRPRTVDAVVDGMARMASVMGMARDAAPIVAALRARIARTLERTLTRRARPLVYVEFSPDGRTGGPQSFLDDLVTKAGGVNLGGVARVEWPVVSAATVRRLDPDVIVIARYPASATRESVLARVGWQGIAAVKSGRVVEMDPGTIKRPGAAVIDGLETLADICE